MNAQHAKKIGGPVLVASWLAALGGCAVIMDPATEAASPVAPRIEALVDANRTYPRWADFPRSTGVLPEPIEVAARVGTLQGDGDSLAAAAARIEWMMEDPVAFTAEVNRRLDAQAMAPASIQTEAEIEALAEQIRRRGAAPPPIDRSQPPR
jgi:hypothetical protein